ncbi:MAG TPA: trypsin-like peptidase domain-containing protein [Candidatus Saccharimonadia bacterium]|nr:trypsin-like peptidase domain-containing protein [Candidatus Saccharimonadia bacterium]
MEPEDTNTTEVNKDETAIYRAVPNPSKRRLEKDQTNKKGVVDRSNELKRLNQPFAYLILVLALCFGIGYGGAVVENHSQPLSSSQVKEIVTSKDQLISAIAADVSPSVVSVDAIGTTQTTDIFGSTQSSPEESEGTGIVISNSGYVVTNRHVIPSGTTSVSLTLNDGTVLNSVKVIGMTNANDPLDIAILKISNPPTDLQPALLGDSSQANIGDTVVAIGNALGQFQNTVTSGIISGRGRSLQAGDESSTTSETLQDMLQTDAAINEGNSGGPLINTNGEVIGINTALASGGAQNIGFSIPINDVKGIIKGILNTGKFERPYIGVYYVTINSAVAKQYNLSQTSGAYIAPQQAGQASIIAGSPAAQAGLKVGDIITSVNGVSVNQNNSLESLIDENSTGTTINLQIIRSGVTKIVSVTVGNNLAGV